MSKDSVNNESIWTKFKNIPIDNPFKTMLITVTICFVASLFVTYSAITLRPIQEINKLNEKRKNILVVAGLYEDGKTIEQMFESIDTRVVDLRTGKFTDAVNVNYNEIAGAKDPKTSRALTKGEDIASIRRQSFYKVIYLVKDTNGKVEKIILPVHGYGLWSTLYGFIAVGVDGNSVYGLKFYSHGETPGLGGEVDNPVWIAKWNNKKIFKDNGEIGITVMKNPTDKNYEVDALSGATLTSAGVKNLVQFWVSNQGFGEFLESVKRGGIE